MAAVPGMFDVFLNHRGPDVKGGFASHLHQALQEAGCRPFLDKQSLEKGQHGQKKIYEALGCASVHVPIFSKHYADSDYCLDELCAMLESEKLIIPVFYDVSPSVLRCEADDGPYTKAFRETHGRRPASEVKRWKDALWMAAQLSGFQLANYNGDEAQMKTAIVSRVRDHLRASQLLLVAPYQVGLEETSKELIETLNQMEKDVGVLSVVGMGGIGKTTLAKEIYYHFEKNDKFEKQTFLMDVRESAILDLQKQLAHDLFREDVRSMEGFSKCFDRVMDYKVLIVIDDVDQKSQFDQLIPDINKLGPGSRVIITSRESNVVNNIMRNGNCKYSRHEMAPLSTTDSRHLFNWHAFHSTDAIDGFQELAKKVADACCGLPLALEVTGCFLFDKREERDLESTWPQTIKTLLNENKDIFEKLMISYNGLSPEARMMFLDIACFMIGQREHIVMQIFEACKSDYKIPATSFNSLKDKCLVKLDEDRRIVMHDLLRDMGRQVVMNQSHHMEKGTPSHLWDPDMVQRVLQNKEGTNKVRGLSTFGVGRGGINATNVAENYIGMNRLHFLLLDGDNVKGDFSTWSRELSWLQWTNSDISSLPLELDLQKLAVLDLTSNKELMQIWPHDYEITYKDLRTLILSNCEALTELPKDIGKLLKLNELNLAFCSSLKALPDSIFQLNELKHMNLSCCSELGCLPDSIVNLSQLKTFNLRGCSKLENLLVELGKLQSLVELDLSYCFELGCLPDSIVHLSQLKTFNLRGCSKLENLPVEFGKLQSLVELDLSHCSKLGYLPDSIVDLSQLRTFNLRGCSKLENLPVEFGKLQSLVELDLSYCFELGCLPDSIVHLSQLRTFNLRGCSKLENLPVEFGKLQSLVELDLSDCSKLGCLPDSIVDLSQLRTFNLRGCSKLENLPVEFGKLQSLVELDLSDCFELGCLPDSIVHLSQLRTFNLRGCSKLENLPVEFGKLKSLVELDLSNCSKLGCLPDSIVDLSQLKTFNLWGCSKLENLLVEFGKLQSLVELDLSDCFELGCLPDSIVNLSQLRTFDLGGCSKLENLPVEFGKLQSLVELDLSDCSKLGCLPDSIVDLSQLKTFRLSECHKLEVKVDDDQSCSPPGKGNDHHQQISNSENPSGSRKVSLIESFGSDDCVQQQKQSSTVEASDTSENSFQIPYDSIVILGRKGTFEGVDAIEFLFEQDEDMSKVVGVGLQRSKVVVTEQFRVMVIQISEHMWSDLWKETSFVAMNINVPKLPINYKLPMCNLTPEESSKRFGVGLGGIRSEDLHMYVEDNMNNQAGEMFPLIFELAKKMGLKSENAKAHLKGVSTETVEGEVNDQGGTSNEPMDGGDHDQGSTSHEPMEGAVGDQRGISSEHMELGGQIDQQSFGGNPVQLLSESPTGRGPIVTEKNESLTVIVIPECGGTFHKGLTKELAEPDGRIKSATIAPWLKFKFEKLGDTRKITTTIVTQCNLGGGQLKYHEDLDLGYYHDNITISFTCEENLAARLSSGIVTAIDLTKRSMTETFTGSRSSANQISSQANLQVQIPLWGVGMQAQGNMGVTDTVGDSRAIAATMESSNTQFAGFLVNTNECPGSLNYNFLYHVEILEEIAKGHRQFMHAGINKTLWPTIVGEWVPLDREEARLYKFKTERDITSIGSLRRSTAKGEMLMFMQQRYEVSMFINHAMTHIHCYGTTELRELGVQSLPKVLTKFPAI